jgi:metallo-beta-lactamase family protein
LVVIGSALVKTSLSFLGAARNVTGSRYLVEVNGSRLLIDGGLYQERDFVGRNWDAFPVPPKSLDAILLTHAHLDHSGYLPRLAKQGYRGIVYSTPATAEIAAIAFADYAHLQVEDLEHKRTRHQREGRQSPHAEVPLYNDADAVACERLFRTVGYERPVEVADGVEATFHDAGHILGSAMIRLVISGNGGGARTVVFSGDIGRWDKPILNDPTVFDQADYVVMESTYGDRLHEDQADIDSLLEDAILSTVKRGGNVVIPSFAIGRTQEVLYRLNGLFVAKRIPRLSVFIDSPMALRVSEVFQRHRELFDREMTTLEREGHSPFRLPNLKTTDSIEASKAINQVRSGAVIIAGSGMCTGGRIKHHLVANIAREESTILFVGFQAAGTLGREIAAGASEVRILGQIYPVRAAIKQIQGFSAHADRAELLRWVSGLRSAPRQVFVTHGEPESAESFAALLTAQKGWSAQVPHYLDKTMLS